MCRKILISVCLTFGFVDLVTIDTRVPFANLFLCLHCVAAVIKHLNVAKDVILALCELKLDTEKVITLGTFVIIAPFYHCFEAPLDVPIPCLGTLFDLFALVF